MGIINPREVNCFTGTGQTDCLVGENSNAHFLERIYHKDCIVIPEGCKNTILDRKSSDHFPHCRNDMQIPPMHTELIIAGKYANIRFNITDGFNKQILKVGKRVKMRIGYMENGISIKGTGQAGESEGNYFQFNRLSIIETSTIKSSNLEPKG